MHHEPPRLSFTELAMFATTGRPLAAFLAIAALAVGPPSVQGEDTPSRVQVVPAQQERTVADLRAYKALVAGYLAGDTTATQQILEWTPKRLAVVLGVVSGPGKGPAPWDARRLAAAAFMHTDAARLLLDRNETAGVSLHLDVASGLLQKGTPALDAFASRWYLVVSRVLRDRVWLAHAAALLEAGRRRLPGDALVLFESGTLDEVFATDREIPLPSGMVLTPDREDLVEQFGDRHTADLSRASRRLEEAVDAAPADELCRLHLGRVRSLLGDYKAAGPILSDLQRARDDAIAYLASMFLGAAAERRQDRREAERCYRAALARFDRGQAAQVALSNVLLAMGRVGEARSVLAGSMGDHEDSRRDPWWWYHFEPSTVVDARYDRLRAEALR